MKDTLQISIPKPCHEKWSSFTPTRKGGFCESCQKEVVDFTSWTDERIKSYFKKPTQSTCGRFNPHQLKTYSYNENQTTFSGWLSVFVVSILLFFTSKPVHAQRASRLPVATGQLQTKHQGEVSLAPVQNSFQISGEVISAEDGSPIPGVNVILKGTAQGTSTDVDGKFHITTNDSSSQVLVFSFIGLKTVEITYNSNELLKTVSMQADYTQLSGELVIYCGRKFSLKRLLCKIRGY